MCVDDEFDTYNLSFCIMLNADDISFPLETLYRL